MKYPGRVLHARDPSKTQSKRRRKEGEASKKKEGRSGLVLVFIIIRGFLQEEISVRSARLTEILGGKRKKQQGKIPLRPVFKEKIISFSSPSSSSLSLCSSASRLSGYYKKPPWSSFLVSCCPSLSSFPHFFLHFVIFQKKNFFFFSSSIFLLTSFFCP